MTVDDRNQILTRAVELRRRGNAEQAYEMLAALAEHCPDDADVAYQTAWTCDTLGREAEAAPHYERALHPDGLSAEDRLGAFVGLGSTYRVLGEFDLALPTLRRGLVEFPDDAGLQTFLAMALYNTGEAKESVATLLRVLTSTSADAQVQRYATAIRYYADDLDATV
jgi:tetratricopeptide (TPR) repeat protein